MHDLNALVLFVEVAQAGSYTAAAKRLKVPLSTVSRKVGQLEGRLGVQLFQRTTRRVTLTDIGQRYFGYCREVVDKALEAEQAVMSLQSEPTGTLRFGMPYFADDSFSSALFIAFLRRYPKVNVDCVILPNNSDPVANKLDCIMSYGAPSNLDLQTISLGSLRLMLCASSAYLEREGHPKSVVDLTKHSAIRLTGLDWEEWGPTVFKQCEFNYRFSVNDMVAARKMALDDVGIGYFPVDFCGDLLESGKLVNVLPELNNSLPLQICYPVNRHISQKLRVFLDHLIEVCLRDAPWNVDA